MAALNNSDGCRPPQPTLNPLGYMFLHVLCPLVWPDWKHSLANERAILADSCGYRAPLLNEREPANEREPVATGHIILTASANQRRTSAEVSSLAIVYVLLCIYTEQKSSNLFGPRSWCRLIKEIPAARLSFHMLFAAKLSFQAHFTRPFF
jgi:hypothetical protein